MRWSLIALASAALFASCDEGPPPRATATRSERFDVALVTSGSIADDGWNAGAYEGLRSIQRDLGARVAHREARLPAAKHRAVRELAAAGADLVFAHGEELQAAALAAGPSFRQTVFVVTEGDLRAPNLVPLVARIEEAAWILGMAAGSQTRDGRGAVVAVRSRASERAAAAFRGGAQAMRPGFVLDEVWVADPGDSQTARAAASAAIDAGADVLFQMAGDAGRGAIAACTERGIVCFSAPRKLNDQAPEAILASAVIDFPTAMVGIASLVEDGRFAPRLFSYGMKEGVVTVAWNEELRRRIPSDAMTRIDETEREILEGRFRPPIVAR